MAAGSDGVGCLHFDDYDAARLIGVLGLALILFEGGLATGWRSARCSGRRSGSPSSAPPSPRRSPASPPRSSSTSRRSRGCCSARSSPPPTARRCSPCCGARRCGGGSRSRSRARRASTTRSPCCSSSASSSGSSTPSHGVLDLALLFVRGDGHRRGRGLAVGALAVAALRRLRLDTPGCIRSPRSRRSCSPSARRRRARLGLPRGLPRRAGAGQRAHPGASVDRAFH